MGILEGLQFRTSGTNGTYKSNVSVLKALGSFTDEDFEWKDVTYQTSFLPSERVRVKPVYEYYVTHDVSIDTTSVYTSTFTDKSKALALVARELDNGKKVAIDRLSKTSTVGKFLQDNNIQWRNGDNQPWNDSYFDETTHNGYSLYFRQKPDTYYGVDTRKGLNISANKTFDDVDDLLKYVERMIRTESVTYLAVNQRQY